MAETFDRLPIHNAARGGDIERVKRAIKETPEQVHARDIDGTPLHLAAVEGHREIVELLLANGADVNAEGTVMGATPLTMALSWKKTEVADILRRHGGKEFIDRSRLKIEFLQPKPKGFWGRLFGK